MKFIEVHGDSMNPSLLPNQLLIVSEKPSFTRNDIIVYRFKGKLLIKRLVGLSGDHVLIQDDLVLCNNEEIFRYSHKLPQQYSWEVTSGKMVVLGDNPLNSLDSRRVGLLPDESVTGRIVARIWPPKLFFR